MNINKNIFRKYDIRGVIDVDLTPDIASLIGKGYGTLMRRKYNAKSLIVGGDVRLSTPTLKKGLIKGILSTGCDVIDIGILPTPVAYFAICNLKMDGGVIVTASHNPPKDNGFKLCGKGASPVFDDDIISIYTLIERNDFETGSGSFAEREDLISMYTNHLLSIIKMGPRKLKIVTDCGNATAGMVAPALLRKLGCDVTELFTEPDGNFPNHHPDPTIEKYIEVLKKTVREGDFDIGFGYDGDADRIGLVDETGRAIPGGFILLLLALELLKDNKGATIAYDVKCSRLLNKLIGEAGGKPVMGKTGHAFMKQKMKASGAILGGELSGHIVFNDRYYPYDDAIFVSLRIAEMMSYKKGKLSNLVSWRDTYSATPEIRLDCPDDIKFKVMDFILSEFKSKYKTIDIDGARVEFDDGWGLLRVSNTQPCLVMCCEAVSPHALDRIKNILSSAVEDAKSKVKMD